MGALYVINFPNGKKYVGITSRKANDRLTDHLKNARDGVKTPVYCALRKYADSFEFKVVKEINDWELLCLAEQEAIDLWKTKGKNGYNLTKGGDGSAGLKWTDEQKAKTKRLDIIKGNQYFKGKIHTPESRAKMSSPGNQHAKGKHWILTEEQRKKYSRPKSMWERGKLACSRSLAGALRNNVPVSLLPKIA